MPVNWFFVYHNNAGYDDIDDYNNVQKSVSIYEGEAYSTHQGVYLDRNITLTSQVFYGNDVPRLVAGGASTGGYDQNITFSNPFSDVTTTITTNIKLISVTLTSINPVDEINNKQITLSAFMSNIGAPQSMPYSNEPSLW